MEESAKRKEKLQAMRLEAARAVAPHQPSHSSSFSTGQLPSPSPSLLPLPRFADPPELETPPPAPRFDFYTDPTSAFSDSKRMRGADASGGFSPFAPRRPTPPPSPSFPYGMRNTYVDSSYPAYHQMPHSSESSSFRTPSRVSHNSSWRSPIQSQSPLSGHQGSPVTGLASWNTSGGSSGHGFQAHPSGSFVGSPHFSPGGNQLSNARTSSPYSNFGRGRGGQYSGGSGSRAIGGRGQRFNGRVSTRDDIASYFRKSMLEDPWRDMEPVVGDILEPMSGPGYWLPESVSGKKIKMPETEIRHKLDSKSSLAEFLAASLEETINDDD
ncbi:protein SICKLE-like [Curcuma longa]|uniref:protein SICKLE-like n=1 Tax=Curcuma longa TaxID=136217 RepID=UPI003D9F306B